MKFYFFTFAFNFCSLCCWCRDGCYRSGLHASVSLSVCLSVCHTEHPAEAVGLGSDRAISQGHSLWPHVSLHFTAAPLSHGKGRFRVGTPSNNLHCKLRSNGHATRSAAVHRQTTFAHVLLPVLYQRSQSLEEMLLCGLWFTSEQYGTTTGR